jgi:CRP-like cAMP-binding protein
MNPQLTKINDFITRLDTQTLTALNAISVQKIFKKGDFLLRQNQVCKKSYWIEKGVARKYYLNDGKEITTELYFDNDIAVSFDSYCLQKPSKEYILALTDITISETDFVAFQTAKEQFPKLATLDLMMTEYYAMWLEDRLFQFHTMDATSRYQKLMEDHPHIIQNIPLTFVASYLGISLETLSRIRAKK